MRKVLRLGVIAVGLFAALGTSLQPAAATEVGSVAFQGTAQVGAGLAYPCAPPDNVPGTPKCQTPPVTTAKTDPHKGTPIVNYSFPGGNSTSVSFASNICVGEGESVNKPPKPAAIAGTCTITAHGTVHGHCGLSTGTVHGAAHITGPTGSQSYSFSIKFTGTATVLQITGSVVKHSAPGGTGNISGTVSAVPNPQGSSCLNKAAKQFLIEGSAVIKVSTPI